MAGRTDDEFFTDPAEWEKAIALLKEVLRKLRKEGQNWRFLNVVLTKCTEVDPRESRSPGGEIHVDGIAFDRDQMKLFIRGPHFTFPTRLREARKRVMNRIQGAAHTTFRHSEFLPYFEMVDNTCQEDDPQCLIYLKRIRNPKYRPARKPKKSQLATTVQVKHPGIAPTGDLTKEYVTSLQRSHECAVVAGIGKTNLSSIYIPPRHVLVFPPEDKPAPRDRRESVITEESVQPPRLEFKTFMESRSPDGNLVFVGGPGIGKTSLLAYLAGVLGIEPPGTRKGIPLVFDLGRLFEEYGGDRRRYWDINYRNCAHFLEGVYSNSDCTLYLDGYDNALQFDSSLADFIEKIPDDVPIILSSRPGAFERSMFRKRFTLVHLLEFDKEQIEEFIIKWVDDLDTSSRLRDYLRNNPNIQDFVRNPLILTFYCTVFGHRPTVSPARIADFYDGVIELLMTPQNEGTRRRSDRCAIPDAEKNSFLAHLAYDMVWLNKVHLGRKHFDDAITRARNRAYKPSNFSVGTVSQIRRELTIHNGFLQETSKDVYGFLHPTLQQYFAAVWIQMNNLYGAILNDPELLQTERWQAVISFAGAVKEDATDLVNLLLEEETKRVSPQEGEQSHLLLALRVIGNANSIAPAVYEKVKNRVFSMTLLSDKEVERRNGCIAISPYDAVDLFRPLIQYCGGILTELKAMIVDEWEGYRGTYRPAFALVLLSALQMNDCFKTLCEIIREEGDDKLKLAILQVLGASASDDAYRLISDLFHETPSNDSRGWLRDVLYAAWTQVGMSGPISIIEQWLRDPEKEAEMREHLRRRFPNELTGLPASVEQWAWLGGMNRRRILEDRAREMAQTQPRVADTEK